jgi:transposase
MIGKVKPTFMCCLVGMEACATSHFWAQTLCELGHEVKLMPPAYVKSYVKRGNTDPNDAEAICEAVRRPTMRFVAIKSVDQQSVLALHQTRDLLILQRSGIISGRRWPRSGEIAHFREKSQEATFERQTME